MELRVLNYFLVVAQEGNITTAATRLHVGQPTLSRQLKDLERELGQKLFVRQAHGIRLTEEGQHLRRYAQEMMELSSKIDRDFKIMSSHVIGDVYFGGIDANIDGNARQIKENNEQYPDIVYHYRSCASSDALTLLDRGLLDFAIVSEYVDISQYSSLQVDDDRCWVAFTRRDNPLAAKQSVSVEDLVGEPLLMFDQVWNTDPDVNSLMEWLGEYRSRLKVAATSNLSLALYLYAREGVGTLLTLEQTAAPLWEDTLTIPLEPYVGCSAYMVWRKDRPLSKAAAFALELQERSLKSREMS